MIDFRRKDVEKVKEDDLREYHQKLGTSHID